MAEIKIGLSAVLGDEHLTVLKRAHGPRVNVQVGIALLKRHLEPTCLQQGPEGRCCDPLAKARHHSARHKDVALTVLTQWTGLPTYRTPYGT